MVQEKWVNRRMLILDPRKESIVPEMGSPLRGLPVVDSSCPSLTEEYDWAWIFEPSQCSTSLSAKDPNDQVAQTRSELEDSPRSSVINEPTRSDATGLRRSTRIQERRLGKWPNAIT